MPVEKGYERSEETKRRMSEAAKKRWASDDKNRARMSAFSREIWSDPEHKKTISAKAKAQAQRETDDRRERARVQAQKETAIRSERHKSLWENEDFRANVSRKSRERARSADAREQMSARSKALWASGACDHIKQTGGKGGRYKGIYMRSSWERRYATMLDEREIAWEYEPKRFLLKSGKTYCPDFYLPETDEWVEVKGYWRDDARKKFDAFCAEYPEIKISVVGEQSGLFSKSAQRNDRRWRARAR